MTLKTKLVGVVNGLPYVRKLHQENVSLKENCFYPPGHYYSPVISVSEIKKREAEIWEKGQIDGIAGIDLCTEDQLRLIEELAGFYAELPFNAEKSKNLRYYFENDYYTYTDGIVLYAMIRRFRPKNIIEIGSGFSSALMLDSNELFFDKSIQLTFIEPYPDRLYSLINEEDKKSTRIIEKFVQAVDLDEFEKLGKGDILFIDSTHVVKTGSDVNHILFEILPRLKSGVLVHFHDVFYPFEYPKEWVFSGWNWNENYFLKAFLMYNTRFKIRLFSQYIHQHYKGAFSYMPLAYKNQGGNFWLEKV